MFECVVKELLDEPDNIEIIREQIAAILLLETRNQLRLAQENGSENVRDFDIKIFLEHELPFSLKEKTDVDNFPCVNVALDNSVMRAGSTKTRDKVMKATFLIDCYDHGNFSGDGLTGRSASVAAWKTGRIIRNILCASDYSYLKLQGVVSQREVVKMQTGKPSGESGAANISICRITLEVTYDEQSPEVLGAPLERLQVAVDVDGMLH